MLQSKEKNNNNFDDSEMAIDFFKNNNNIEISPSNLIKENELKTENEKLNIEIQRINELNKKNEEMYLNQINQLETENENIKNNYNQLQELVQNIKENYENFEKTSNQQREESIKNYNIMEIKYKNEIKRLKNENKKLIKLSSDLKIQVNRLENNLSLC